MCATPSYERATASEPMGTEAEIGRPADRSIRSKKPSQLEAAQARAGGLSNIRANNNGWPFPARRVRLIVRA